MFGKLAEAQKKSEEIKAKLSSILVNGEDSLHWVTISMDANKIIREVQISEICMHPENKKRLEDAIKEALSNALAAADNVSQSEMKNLLGSMLPGMGNLFGKG